MQESWAVRKECHMWPEKHLSKPLHLCTPKRNRHYLSIGELTHDQLSKLMISYMSLWLFKKIFTPWHHCDHLIILLWDKWMKALVSFMHCAEDPSQHTARLSRLSRTTRSTLSHYCSGNKDSTAHVNGHQLLRLQKYLYFCMFRECFRLIN